MATLSVNNPTLADWTKSLDPNGKIDKIVEILNQTNEVLDDMVWLEGNLETGHRTTVRTGLPKPTWRALYGFVQPTKSTKVQVTDNSGSMEAVSLIDKALADLNGNTSEFRLSEDKSHIEGMAQEMADTLFYGNESTEPDAFTGLAPRYNSTSAANADNLLDNGGSGNDVRSVWLVVWGEDTCHGFFPKGSRAGLAHSDMGEMMIPDTSSGNNGGWMKGYMGHYKWDAGLTLRDWRYVVRIHSVPKDVMTGITSGAKTKREQLLSDMYRAIELIPNINKGKACFYMARDVRTAVRIGYSEAVKGSTLEMKDVGGHMTYMFQDIPIKRVDALAKAESAL